MSIFSRRRLGRRQSEQLLDGVRPASPAFDDLVGLLAAARGPQPADAELPGEQAALAAFRRAVSTAPAAGVAPAGPHPLEENSPVRTLALRRLLAVKVLAASVLTVGLGGVAMAATGMPLVPGGDHRAATPAAHASPTGSPSDRPGTTPSGRETRSGTPSATRTRSTAHRATHEKQLVACWAYGAGRSKATPSPVKAGVPFADLARAAGGKDRVAAYCAALVAELCTKADPGHLPGCPKADPTRRAQGSPSDRPTRSGTKPATRPAASGSPTDRPTARPSRSAPDGSPTQHASQTRTGR